MTAEASSPQAMSAATVIQTAWRRAYAGPGPTDPPRAPLAAPSSHRGVADALAAWGRWHPVALDGGLSPAQWPWYAVLERARVETLAGQDLPGMALNLADLAPGPRRPARGEVVPARAPDPRR